MQSFLVFVDATLLAIILLHFGSNENALANAIPALNGGGSGGASLLVRKKRQDEGEDGGGGDGEPAAEEEEKAEDDAGDGDGDGEGKEEAEGDGEDGEKEEEEKPEEDDGGEGGKDEGDEEEGKGGKGKGGKENGGGQQPPNAGTGGMTGGGATACTDKANGCEPGFCTDHAWASAHCAGTCAHVLSDCVKSGAAMQFDQSKSCADKASNCGTIPDICNDNILSVCGCPHKCGRCAEHQTYMSQGMCTTVQ